MDIAWDQYRPILRRAYFGEDESCLAPRDSDSANDFWTFFKKYQTVCKRRNIKCDRTVKSNSESSSLLGPGCSYDKCAKAPYSFAISSTSKYSLRQVPSYIVAEFEFVIHSWLAFCQKQKLTRLKKLRRAQHELPIACYREKIVETVLQSNIVIIAGDTGCGKSTQVPQYLLGAGFDQICCTQPRRIACISLSKRVAFETLNEYGTQIAFQIRFEKTKSSHTKMVFLTEGLLLRQMSSDPDLDMYQVIILDEIHERNLQGDFLMGMLRQLVLRRPELKLILMSATINLQLFTEYFKGAPVIQVPGRLYPIDVQYHAVGSRSVAQNDRGEPKAEKIDPAPYMKLLQMIDLKFAPAERGDMLVFLSGISEMTTVAEALKLYAEQSKRWIILLLHSTLSLEEQDKVFDVAPEGVRKCVLSTNIAETSVTIDGVRFVIDSGKAKEMRYDSATRMHQLKEIWVSKASGEQRKGRAGRTGPGVCYRLYSKLEYDRFEEYSASEIQRVSLESLALQMFSMNLGVPVRLFPFIEPPQDCAFEEAIEALKDQGALTISTTTTTGVVIDEKTASEELSALGRMLVSLPVDVSVGKMLVLGCLFKQVEAVLTVAAGLSVQSPFTNRSYRDLDCLAARRSLISDHGDAITLLNTYREWLQEKSEGDGGGGTSSSRRWARHRGIEEQRLYEITKLRRQFHDLLEDGDLIDRRELAEQSASSAERRIKKGEMQRLRDLKRKFRHEQRKRKVLKSDQHYDSIMADAERTELEEAKSSAQSGDINAVEFQMKHSYRDLREAFYQHKLNHSTATILKAILCSGLYPQYAILDPYNSYKLGADQIAHTKAKPFTVLHPNGCLAQEPEVLALMKDKDGNSANHQLLFYGLLLETTKAYLVNCVRVPALHTLLLFARCVETSSDCTRVVCDDFVEFVITTEEYGSRIVAMASEIRALFSKCLERKLEGNSYKSDILTKRLIDYYSMEVVYNMKRLIVPKGDMEKKVSRATRGISIGTLPDGGSGNSMSMYIATKWTCVYCKEDFYSSSTEKIEHMRECGQSMAMGVAGASNDGLLGDEEATDSPSESTMKNPLAKQFYCDKCQQELELTPVEILKHKRAHK